MLQEIAISGLSSPTNLTGEPAIITSTHFHQPPLVNEVIFTPSAPALPVFSDSSNQPNHQTDDGINNNNNSDSSDNTMPNFDCALTAAIEALLAAIAGEPMPTSIYLYPRTEAAQQERCFYARLAWHTTCVACYSLVWPPPTATITRSKRNAQRQQQQTLSCGWKLFSAGAPVCSLATWSRWKAWKYGALAVTKCYYNQPQRQQQLQKLVERQDKHKMEEAAKAAAKWWIDVLKDIPFKNTGDDIASIMLTMEAIEKPQPTSEELERLKPFLEQEFLALLEQDNRNIINCEYGPASVLCAAVSKSGVFIHELLWPFKTMMILKPNEVTVAHGSGAPFKTIYQTVAAAKPPQPNEA